MPPLGAGHYSRSPAKRGGGKKADRVNINLYKRTRIWGEKSHCRDHEWGAGKKRDAGETLREERQKQNPRIWKRRRGAGEVKGGRRPSLSVVIYLLNV